MIDIIKYLETSYNQRRIQKVLDFKTSNQMTAEVKKLLDQHRPNWGILKRIIDKFSPHHYE